MENSDGVQTKKTVVIGTIGSDAHVAGSWILKRSFQDAGFNVVFLGAMVSQKEFINAAIETGADAILVSSMYGMGILDCEGFRKKCTESGLKDILLYVGGMLAAPMELAKNWNKIEEKMKSEGFDRVYAPRTLPEVCIEDLKKDLKIS
ncbi:MAG: methylaspartate mutase subunit S [Thermodesulfobacteriota bacterium]|nr:methylaspartate mutase subunit S [Thermodesulfobacteriota bacterium]